jgi:hypothetical protein
MKLRGPTPLETENVFAAWYWVKLQATENVALRAERPRREARAG